MPHLLRLVALGAILALLTGCAPEVGSEQWCRMMDDKAKGDWTANEAAAYAKSCVLGMKNDE